MQPHPNELLEALAFEKAHPDSGYTAPTSQDLESLQLNEYVRVAMSSEMFFVLITAIDGDRITGIIDNHLANSAIHGYNYTDEIEFEKKHVFALHR